MGGIIYQRNLLFLSLMLLFKQLFLLFLTSWEQLAVCSQLTQSDIVGNTCNTLRQRGAVSMETLSLVTWSRVASSGQTSENVNLIIVIYTLFISHFAVKRNKESVSGTQNMCKIKCSLASCRPLLFRVSFCEKKICDNKTSAAVFWVLGKM